MILAAWDGKHFRLGGGLVRQPVDLVTHEVGGAFVFVLQSLVWDGNEGSMASVFLVPSIITQFSYMKKLSMGEKPSTSKMKQRLSCNTSMFEMRSLSKMLLVLSNRVNQCILDTSLVHMPLYFFFPLIVDHVFQIGLARWD